MQFCFKTFFEQLKSLVCLQLLQVWKISERVRFNVPNTVFVQVPGKLGKGIYQAFLFHMNCMPCIL